MRDVDYFVITSERGFTQFLLKTTQLQTAQIKHLSSLFNGSVLKTLECDVMLCKGKKKKKKEKKKKAVDQSISLSVFDSEFTHPPHQIVLVETPWRQVPSSPLSPHSAVSFLVQ